jgi:hypothetical protein
LLKIENIKLPPAPVWAELTAEAARLLRVKEFVSLRVLRRSVDARDGVELVYTVEAIVKDETAVLPVLCRSRKVSRMERSKPYALPDPISRRSPAGGGGCRARRSFLPLLVAGHRPDCAHFSSSAAVPWSSAGRDVERFLVRRRVG